MTTRVDFVGAWSEFLPSELEGMTTIFSFIRVAMIVYKLATYRRLKHNSDGYGYKHQSLIYGIIFFLPQIFIPGSLPVAQTLVNAVLSLLGDND